LSALNQNRYDELLRRVGDLKGGGSKVNDALTELFPMIDVESRVPELLLLGGRRLAFGFANSPGVAGFVSATMLRNPTDSGNIITVHEASISGVGQDLSAGTTNNTYANAGVQEYADTRAGVGTTTVGQVLFEELLVAAPDRYRLRTNTGTQVIYRPEHGIAVLAPGTAYGISGRGLNVGIIVGFVWTERVALPSELNF